MLLADFARAPILAAIPLLHAAGLFSFPLLLGLVALLGCFMPPYYASQRTICRTGGGGRAADVAGNSLIEGGAAFSALIGPALAGLLIPVIGARNVLYVDAATYFVAFLLVMFFVPKRKPIVDAVRPKVLAGVRFLLGDTLLGPIAAVIVAFGFFMPGMFDQASRLCVRGLRRERAHRRPFLCRSRRRRSRGEPGCGGSGSKDGAATPLGARHARLRRPAVGAAVPTPWPVVFVALFLAMFCTPLINGPLIAVLTARTPGQLRAMVITAVITINTLAAPLGFIAAGLVIEHWGIVPLFTTVVAGATAMAAVYGAIVLRHRDVDTLGEPATIGGRRRRVRSLRARHRNGAHSHPSTASAAPLLEAPPLSPPRAPSLVAS